MAEYRLYFFDARNGRIDRFESFEAQDDDQALTLIEPRIGDHPLELWTGGRKVGRFETALAVSRASAASRLVTGDDPADASQRKMFSSWS